MKSETHTSGVNAQPSLANESTYNAIAHDSVIITQNPITKTSGSIAKKVSSGIFNYPRLLNAGGLKTFECFSGLSSNYPGVDEESAE